MPGDAVDEQAPFEDVSIDQFKSLIVSIGRILDGSRHRDQQAVLREIVHAVHDLLHAESCSIFLVKPEDPVHLYLAAQYSDLHEYDVEAVTVEKHQRPRGGLTGYLAHQGEMFNSFGDRLQAHPFSAHRPVRHLRYGCRSLLVIPVKDRKSRLLALVKVDNKLGADGQPLDEEFTKSEERIASILARNPLALALEVLRMEDALKALMGKLGTAESVGDLLTVFLKKILPLVDAYRGDFLLARKDGLGESLIVRAQVGGSVLGVGQPAPEKSIVYRMFLKSKGSPPEAVPFDDVSQFDDYYAANTRTQSEVVVPLRGPLQQTLGVLNVESEKKNGFDELDLRLLESVASYAAAATLEITRRVALEEMTEWSFAGENVLPEILDALKAAHGYKSAVVWVADIPNQRLVLRQTMGCKPIPDLSQYCFGFDEKSLAAKVYRDGTPYFSADPETDREVSRKMWEAFGIQNQPLFGIPLLWRDRKMGVLVAWGSEKMQNSGESATEIERRLTSELTAFARMAAATLSNLELDQRRHDALRKTGDILNAMRRADREIPGTPFSGTDALGLIAESALASGFERIQLFEYRAEPDRFAGARCLRISMGRDESTMRKDLDEFRKVEILAEKNPYAKDTVENYRRGFWEARTYSSEFGDDPDCARLGRRSHQPWTVVPICTTRRLYGYIAADRALMGGSITPEQEEFLTIFGALASLARAINEAMESRRKLDQQRMADDLMANAFHNLKTPVFSVGPLLQELDDPAITAAHRTEVLHHLRAQAEQMENLATRAAEYSKAVLAQPAKSPTSLSALVQSSCDCFRSQEKEDKEIQVNCSPGAEPSLVSADATGLYIVINNLLENAVRFSPRKATIDIEVRASGQQFEVSVRDRGPGIPEEQKSEIFKEFVSFPSPEGRRGSGLGLAISRRIIEEHGGVLDVESVGGGARFYFRLPGTTAAAGTGSDTAK